MDFALYARVLWRFRLLVALGILVAASLATLSFVKVSADGLTYRDTELWSSTTRLGVTQNGFPWGRLFAVPPEDEGSAAESQQSEGGIPIANPARFNELAVLYAELATSDPVLQLLRRDGPLRGKIIATPLRAAESNTMLPLIDVTAIATTPRGAVGLAQRSAQALERFLTEQQRANEVPDEDRVVVQQVERAKRAVIYQPRSKTMPIVIFLTVMFAVIGLVFILHNVSRGPARNAPAQPELLGSEQRRSA